VIEVHLGLHKLLATRLFKAGCKVSVVHPVFIESFAQRLRLKIDQWNQEDILTRYGITPFSEISERANVHDYYAIKQLHARKKLLEIDIQREHERLNSLRKTQVTGLALLSTERTVKYLESEFALICEEIMKVLLRGYLLRVAKSRFPN
jgi:transposase